MRYFNKRTNKYWNPIINLDKLWTLVGEEVCSMFEPHKLVDLHDKAAVLISLCAGLLYITASLPRRSDAGSASCVAEARAASCKQLSM